MFLFVFVQQTSADRLVFHADTLEEDVKELLEIVKQKITTQIMSGHLPNPPHGR